MHERKIEMARRSCGFIGLPGGYGTFEEVFEVITWTQLGIHAKRMRSTSPAPHCMLSLCLQPLSSRTFLDTLNRFAPSFKVQ